jgi:hypothetical protein
MQFGLLMQNSFSNLRDKSDDVPLAAEFLGTDSTTARAAGERAPRKRFRLQSPESGSAGGARQGAPTTKWTEKKETNRQETNGGRDIENTRDPGGAEFESLYCELFRYFATECSFI